MLSKEQLYQMENGLGADGGARMDWEELKKVEEKIKTNPKDFRPWAARGILYFNEDFQQAIESFSQAIALVPFDGNHYYSRGRKYMSQDRYPQGLADLALATRLSPGDSIKWHFLGVAYFFLNRFKDAIKCFERAIELDPENVDHNTPPEYDWIWMSHMQLGEKEKAARSLDPITEETPVHPADLMYLKRVLLYKGLTPIEDYIKNIERGHDLHEITELFGVVNYLYHVAGDTERALYYVDELLKVKTCHHAWGYKMALLYNDAWRAELG